MKGFYNFGLSLFPNSFYSFDYNITFWFFTDGCPATQTFWYHHSGHFTFSHFFFFFIPMSLYTVCPLGADPASIFQLTNSVFSHVHSSHVFSLVVCLFGFGDQIFNF